MNYRFLATVLAMTLINGFALAEFQMLRGGDVATSRGAGQTVAVRYTHSFTMPEVGPRRLNIGPAILDDPANLDLALMAQHEGEAPNLELTSFMIAAPWWDGSGEWTTTLTSRDGNSVSLPEGAIEQRPVRIGSIQGLQVLVDRSKISSNFDIQLTAPASRSALTRLAPIDRYPDVDRMVDDLFLNGSQMTEVPVGLGGTRGTVTAPPLLGDLRAEYSGGNEILRVPLADLGISAGDIPNLRARHHGTTLRTGGVLGGTDLWLYAPLIETNQNMGDAIFFTPGATAPSASMTSRPAFDTLSAAGTEVAYERTREYEWNLLYERGSINPLGDRFVFHRILSGQSIPYDLPVNDHITYTTVTMDVEVHGFNFSAANPDHFATFSLESFTSPQESWDGRFVQNYSYDVPLTLPNAADLQFTHSIPAGSPFSGGIDIQNLEKVALTWTGYPRVDPVSLSTRVQLPSEPTARRVTIGGFPGGTTAADILLLDIKQLNNVSIIDSPASFTDTDGTVAFEFEVPAGPADIYVQAISTISAVNAVTPGIEMPLPPTGNALAGVYVRDPIFDEELEPLVTLRGPGIVELDPQAAYDTFNGGQQSREAIVEAVQWIVSNAATRVPVPQLLLVGHGSLDPKDYLGTQSGPQIHPFVEDSAPTGGITIENPVDFQYGLIEGSDGFQDVYYARIPAKTEAEVTQAVAKIIQHNDLANSLTMLNRPGVFITDNQADFHADIPTFLSKWDKTWHPSIEITIPLSTTPDPVALRQSIYDALQNGDGASFVLYTGHGNVDRWASENIFNNSDVPLINTEDKWPIVSTFTCLNGYYAFPGASTRSLAEVLLFTDYGASAAIAPCSVDFYFEQKSFALELLDLLGDPNARGVVGLPTTVGELLTRTRNNYLVKYPGFERTAHEYLMFTEPMTPIPLASSSNVPLELWLVQ